MKYLALLRGINVGGKNKISMSELRLVFEEAGCRNVATYINSGNVLFEADQTPDAIASNIEALLPRRFQLDSELIKLLVLSKDELEAVIKNAPKGFGTEPAKYYCDAIFLMGISVEDAMPVFSPRDGVDKIWSGHGVIYSQRLAALRVKSRLSKIAATPLYKSMTIRSWGTTQKLLQLMIALP
jgi:uncharacterized protein (DUF1697 family)